MSKRTIVTCDECGTERKASNHWFSLSASATMPRLSTFDEADQMADSPFRLDCCGQRCVMTAIQRWFDQGSALDIPSIPHPRGIRKSVASSHSAEPAPRLQLAATG
jgi:endogenous inhibitor of DNA gyrase (YacG/DUF329 family)